MRHGAEAQTTRPLLQTTPLRLDLHNYATTLIDVQRFEEARSLMRKTIPVAQRVLGTDNHITLKMTMVCARALRLDTDATLDDLRETVATLEDTARIARRVLGGSHPIAAETEEALRLARSVLRARETPPPTGDLAEEVD